MLALEALRPAVQHLVVRADLELAATLHCVPRIEGQIEDRQLERAGIGVDRPWLVEKIRSPLRCCCAVTDG